MGKRMVSRREFLCRTGQAVLAFAGLPACLPRMPFSSPAGARNWHQSPADWDPVFGPPLQWFSRYGGPGDFYAHLRAGAEPGVDYDVPAGTLLVPSMSAFLVRGGEDRNGSRFALLASVFHPSFQVGYGHLERTVLDTRFKAAGVRERGAARRVRKLNRGEIIAFSGNSGQGPPEYGGIQPPHLHLAAFWDDGERPHLDLNPEKFGPGGGRPVYWDGKTPLDADPGGRSLLLSQTLRSFEAESGDWEETGDEAEAKGVILEFCRSLENPAPEKIPDLKPFQDLRAYLQKEVLEQKKFRPGSGPYTLMLRVLSYSTDPSQKVILTLPFIAPGLEGLYRKPIFEEGQFVTVHPPGGTRPL